jgi:hypothetical protein
VFTQTHTHTYTHTHTHAAGQPWFPHRHRRDITLKIPRQQQGCLLSPSVMLRATSRSRESLPPADDLRLACALFALLRGKLWEIFTCRWKQWAIFTCRWKQWAISALCGWRCEQTLPCAGKNCQVSSCDTKSMCLSSLYSVCTLAAWGKWFLWLSAMTECQLEAWTCQGSARPRSLTSTCTEQKGEWANAPKSLPAVKGQATLVF